MTDNSTEFEIQGDGGVRLRGDLIRGQGRQLLFITGFLSKRWGNKSKALAGLCREKNWGFCCFDFRGSGESEGEFSDYTLSNWVEDSVAVAKMLTDGPPLTIVGSSLGGWLAWLVGQQNTAVENTVLLCPAFNMMGARAQQVSSERRHAWKDTGWMPYDDDELHRDFPLSWKWVEESEDLWTRRFQDLRRVNTTILHGLQDTVILPSGSWGFTQELLANDPDFPIELILKRGDHRFSTTDDLDTFLKLVSERS